MRLFALLVVLGYGWVVFTGFEPFTAPRVRGAPPSAPRAGGGGGGGGFWWFGGYQGGK